MTEITFLLRTRKTMDLDNYFLLEWESNKVHGGIHLLFKAKKKAEIGDHIFFKDGVKGIVKKVNENSVITNITENDTELEFKENITVVAHKNYKVLA